MEACLVGAVIYLWIGAVIDVVLLHVHQSATRRDMMAARKCHELQMEIGVRTFWTLWNVLVVVGWLPFMICFLVGHEEEDEPEADDD